MNNQQRYALIGAASGFLLPIVGTVLVSLERTHTLSMEGVKLAWGTPLLWLVGTMPVVIAAFAALAGYRHDEAVNAEGARRDALLKTASELFAAAQSLLSTVSSFSSTTAETAASVRETTATMGQLGHTATQAALTAETVIGLARKGERTSKEGLATVETSLAELMKLADEVRALSQKIEGLNTRMRDIFEIASVVNYIADRSQRLADHASAEAAKAAVRGFNDVVVEMRAHADDAKKASSQVKGILSDVHKAMLSAMTAAEVGIRRAEQGAQVASGTGETIRKLATALQESSQAAKEIATVAQQQDHGIDQVLKAMNEIYLATQETMSSTQSVATEAKALNDLASGLKRAVGI